MMHRNHAERRATELQGFTLVEVLIAVMIMGMMMMSITKMLTAVRTTRDTVHNIQESMLAGPAILDLMERDLAGILVMDRPLALHLQVTNRIDLDCLLIPVARLLPRL